MQLIYVAGKLNGDACEYISNVTRMIKYAEDVRKLGCCVAVPCNDLVHGLIIGTHQYKDYFDNNVEILKRCDAMALTPGWITSEGTKKEIEIANYHDIPVLKNLAEVEIFLKRNYNNR
jgi:hypothetical protein